MNPVFAAALLLFLLPLTAAAVTADPSDTPDVKQALESPPPSRRTVIDATPPRGRLLYENHCTECHASQVHIRRHSKARTIGDLRRWVGHWARQLQLDWTAQEIGDVVFYLNQTFYHYVE